MEKGRESKGPENRSRQQQEASKTKQTRNGGKQNISSGRLFAFFCCGIASVLVPEFGRPVLGALRAAKERRKGRAPRTGATSMSRCKARRFPSSAKAERNVVTDIAAPDASGRTERARREEKARGLREPPAGSVLTGSSPSGLTDRRTCTAKVNIHAFVPPKCLPQPFGCAFDRLSNQRAGLDRPAHKLENLEFPFPFPACGVPGGEGLRRRFWSLCPNRRVLCL